MSIVVEEATFNEEQATENQEVVTEEVETEALIEPDVPPEAEYQLPEKYAGKTLEDVIEMHQNAEKVLGKQGKEVGEQRKLIETLIKSQEQATDVTATKEEPQKFEDVFYDDPEAAVKLAVENHPDILEAKRVRVEQLQVSNVAKLEAVHPEFMDVVKDKDFQNWVGDSKIRTELFHRADKYDFDSADELFSNWKLMTNNKKTVSVKKAEEDKRQEALKRTKSETRSSGDSIGGKKIYRRADLINLQVVDPGRYEAMADEIQSAYAEGRVR
jgi:hypothetical protein